jgi:hypothetical protein
MTKSRWTLLGVIVVCAALGFWYSKSRPHIDNEIDLLAKLPEAEKRTNVQGVPQFVVQSVTIDGVAKQSILAVPHSRLIYPLVVPRDGWFEVAFAMKPETWDLPGDGAQFRIGISEGRKYEELLRQYVNPKRGDRRWFSARLDLSPYEGRQIKLILNTDPGPPEGHDNTNDQAVWAEPRVYSKH